MKDYCVLKTDLGVALPKMQISLKCYRWSFSVLSLNYPYFYFEIPILPRSLLKKKKKPSCRRRTVAVFFFYYVILLQFQHKPINPLLLQTSSSATWFFFCSCGFFFSHFFVCNIFLSSCLLGEEEELYWVRNKTWRRDKMVSGGKEKIFDGNGERNGWMRKKVKEKNK